MRYIEQVLCVHAINEKDYMCLFEPLVVTIDWNQHPFLHDDRNSIYEPQLCGLVSLSGNDIFLKDGEFMYEKFRSALPALLHIVKLVSDSISRHPGH